MINLLLSIIFSTAIYVVFGYLKKQELPALPSILVNYFTASLWGFIFSGQLPPVAELHDYPWFLLSAGMGALFVSVFYLVGKTSQVQGMTVASVASKMSMVIPIVYTLIFIGEPFTWLKLTGFVLALAAVYFTSLKADGSKPVINEFYLPLLVFIGSGLVDVAIKYAEHHFYTSPGFLFFTPCLFFFAGASGTAGTLIFSPSMIITIKPKSIIYGIVLGTTNYFSLVYIMKAMADKGLESSLLFPMNNLGIVCLTALIGYMFFKEKLSSLNLLGLGIAAIAVILMSIAV